MRLKIARRHGHGRCSRRSSPRRACRASRTPTAERRADLIERLRRPGRGALAARLPGLDLGDARAGAASCGCACRRRRPRVRPGGPALRRERGARAGALGRRRPRRPAAAAVRERAGRAGGGRAPPGDGLGSLRGARLPDGAGGEPHRVTGARLRP